MHQRTPLSSHSDENEEHDTTQPLLSDYPEVTRADGGRTTSVPVASAYYPALLSTLPPPQDQNFPAGQLLYTLSPSAALPIEMPQSDS